MQCEHVCSFWRQVSETGLAIFSFDGYGRRLCHAGGENHRVSGLFWIYGCGRFCRFCRLSFGGYPRRCLHSCLDGVFDLLLRLEKSRPLHEIFRICLQAKRASFWQL